MGQAYSRLLQKPSVCMAASGPGVINLTTGIANALIDCCPVVAVGGSSPIGQNGRQVFQEIDQLAIMKPCTKWADRVYNLKRIPELPILVVVSLNGGWTADPQGNKPGRNLGYTRFDKMAETLGCHGDYVEEPAKIRPALDRAQREVDRGNVALVNVKTDHRARAGTLTFAQYST